MGQNGTLLDPERVTARARPSNIVKSPKKWNAWVNCGESAMNSVGDVYGGVWRHISTHSPAPELNEIARIIGQSIIDRNSDLIEELKALKDIVFENSGGRINGESNWGRSKKTTGRRAISEARQYSQLHYGEDHMRDVSAVDLVYAIKNFSIESTIERLDDIREGLEVEKTEISQEIDRLNDSLSGGFGGDCETSQEYEHGLPRAMTSMTMSAVVPSEKTETCTVCGIKRPASSFTGKSGSVCGVCQTTRALRDAKIGSGSASSASLSHSRSVPSHLSTRPTTDTANEEPAPTHSKQNNNAGSPGTGTAPLSARGSSRFRSRLDSARFEHHFLDEF